MRPPKRKIVIGAVVVFLTTLYAGIFGSWKKIKQNDKSQDLIYPVILFNDQLYISGSSRMTPEDDPMTRHAFNELTSNSLASDRKLPDPRHANCKSKNYEFNGQPKVSVVIAFHNEARSTLLRTVMSVLNRSPSSILEEVLLIDDQSEDPRDGFELTVLPKVKLFRNNVRQGVVRSRDLGARMSTGDHVAFLDSHSEVNSIWLEPLLERALQSPKTLCSPVIDIIDSESFEYRPSSAHLKGGFDWSLHFKWLPLTAQERLKQKDPSIPFHSPIIPGGLFLVNKDWFLSLGGFDTGIDIWGAENFELSIKSWLCNGAVESVPCSRVGHVFRNRHPFTFPNGSSQTYLRNTRRVAEVWLDEYKSLFYESKPAAINQHPGSLEERIELKSKLACKPFKWFLDEIYPELKLPHSDAVAFGQLRQGESCLDIIAASSANKNNARKSVSITSCLLSKPSQDWSFSSEGYLVNDRKCLSTKNVTHIALEDCLKGQNNQKWARRRRRLVHSSTGLCLESNQTSDSVKLSKCQHYAFSQQWDFSVELQTFDDNSLKYR